MIKPLFAMTLPLVASLAASCAVPTVLAAQDPPRSGAPMPVIVPMPYARVADLVLEAPLAIDATIRSTTRIKGVEAASAPAGTVRLYVEADVGGLIRGPSAIPPRIGYLLDAPLESDGKTPRYKKARVLLFARAVPGSADQVQLVTPAAQIAWTPEVAAQVTAVVREVIAPDAPPVVTGVGNAFHVPGSLPGEGETQIFLTTADRRPIALSVLRRPGEERRWGVALSEIIDESAGPARPDTLLWYRLACTLPTTLPERATAALTGDDVTAAREDYAFVIRRLGRCAR